MKDCIVYQSQKSKVFQRVDNQGRVYAVKVLNFEFPRPSDIDKFLNEFEILKLLAATGARQAVQKTRENGRHVLILDWIEGQPLKKVFHGKSGDIADILYRGGSVCLNSLEPFLKWFFRSVMPLPGLVAVFSGMPDRAFVRPVPNAASLCCKSADIAGCFRGRRIRFHMHAGKPPRI